MRSLQNHMQQMEALKVADLWLNVSHHPPWRTWKTLSHNLNIPADCDLQPWRTIASQRKIRIINGSDILQWGHSPLGTFKLKKPTFFERISISNQRRVPGILYGDQNCGQRSQLSSDSWYKIESLPGTISGNVDLLGPRFVIYVNKRKSQ
jgi:hypothetical protein